MHTHTTLHKHKLYLQCKPGLNVYHIDLAKYIQLGNPWMFLIGFCQVHPEMQGRLFFLLQGHSISLI